MNNCNHEWSRWETEYFEYMNVHGILEYVEHLYKRVCTHCRQIERKIDESYS